MNYRHHFHAGNFADVMKHTLLLALVRGMQRKEKGFLYLDTHAGRGAYDLAAAAQGDSLERRPEWPDGLGRLERVPEAGLPGLVRDYFVAVREFASPDVATGFIRPYPGSPRLVYGLLRSQDRMVLSERHPEEHAHLQAVFQRLPRVRVSLGDGYAAVAAALPPLERRALVLIDPPYEALDEYAQVVDALREGLRRLPGGTFAIWYPLTERARVEAFFENLCSRSLPPTWVAELAIAGPAAPVKLKGCGLVVVNPPWQLDQAIEPVMPWLAQVLAQHPGGTGLLRWLVPE